MFGYDDESDFNDVGSSPLGDKLLDVATSLGTTYLQENGNPTNTAILAGQSVSTPNLQTASGYSAGFGISGGSLLLLVVVALIAIFAFKKV